MPSTRVPSREPHRRSPSRIPRRGTLYLSVFCNTTVDTVETKWGTQYTGRLDVLNGVPYGITAICTPKETAQP